MAARFNPPPGWQVPAGFRPEPGWSPDVSWPAAPAGWEYWIEEPSAQAPAPPTPRAPALVAQAAAASAPAALAKQPRTRSVAREGAAIPLPAGPLGHLRADVPSAPSPSPSGPASAGGRKSLANQWLIPGVAIACFAFGVIIGIVASLAQASDAGQATVDAQRAQAQVVEDREDLNAQRAELETDRAALAQREQDLVARENAVAQKEAEQVALQTQLDQQKAQAEQDEQDERAGGRGSDPGFQTCDQLRASGYQTPIAKGDPGYSRFLDLDGNDLACD